MRPDTLIVGAGIIGLSIARELHKRGEKNIVLLERGTVGSEASWAAAGMLSPQAEAHEADSFFRLCLLSRDEYPAFAAELLDETGVDVELDRTGTVCAAFSREEATELSKRFEWQSKAGLEVAKLTGSDIRKLEPNLSESIREALLFKGDWQVENRKVVEALVEFARRNLIEIREQTDVRKLWIEHGKAVGVKTAQGNIRCGRIILTAGAWTSLIKPLAVEVKPIRGQMICFRPKNPPLKHVIYGAGGYLVPRRDGRILAGATVEDVGFDKSVTESAVKSLNSIALEILPALDNLKITERWSGLRPFCSDGFPVLGGLLGIDNVTLATGHYRNGILLAPVTANIMADHLSGIDSEYLKEFGAERFANESAQVS
jgi:glycine oxidase